MWRTAWVVGVFVGALWLVGDGFGLVAAVVIVAIWAFVRPPTWTFWAAAVVLMAIAPVALIAQGLPPGSIVGAGFGEDHIIAHQVVLVSLSLAAFAALTEGSGLGGR
jgi:hypothetical protein